MTETSFLLQAMDLLDDGRCPTDLLGNSTWGRLIAAGRELLAATPPVWSASPPTASGYYWFHGRERASDPAPLTMLVWVGDAAEPRPLAGWAPHRDAGPLAGCGTQHLFGLWRKADVPEPPAEGEKKADG